MSSSIINIGPKIEAWDKYRELGQRLASGDTSALEPWIATVDELILKWNPETGLLRSINELHSGLDIDSLLLRPVADKLFALANALLEREPLIVAGVMREVKNRSFDCHIRIEAEKILVRAKQKEGPSAVVSARSPRSVLSSLIGFRFSLRHPQS